MTSLPEEPAANDLPELQPAHRQEPVAGKAWDVPQVTHAPEAPRHLPPGTFLPETQPPPRERGPMRGSRAVDAATIVTLIASLPWMCASFIGVVLLLMVLDWLLPIGALVTPLALAWLVSGIVVFVPRAEPYIAHYVLGLRQPTTAEAALVTATWHEVTRRASLSPEAYSVWIEDRDALTACTPGGNVLAVPRTISELQARQRAAVMAHELGHHLAGHARARMLVQWYSAPARWIMRMYRTVLRATGRGGQLAGPAGAAIGCIAGAVWLIIGVALVFGFYSEPWLRAAIPIMLVLPWLSRWAEKRCDRVAADLGFGPDGPVPLLAGLRTGRWVRARPTRQIVRRPPDGEQQDACAPDPPDREGSGLR
jgi:Zn-dependent protease with chaperone function